MSHHQLTPFETALLCAVEELNTAFEAGLRNANASPTEFSNLQNEFSRFTRDLEKRLSGLERRQDELRQLLESG
jgi:hypothetical protein